MSDNLAEAAKDTRTARPGDRLETMARQLAASENYRVLRRLRPAAPIEAPPKTRTGLFVDVETTGLDPNSDEIIELAMVNRPELSGGSNVWETGAYRKDHEPEALSAGATRACRADGARA